MNNKITRRQFIIWAAVVGGAISVSSFLFVGGKSVLDKRKRANKLAGNAKDRPVEGNRWFTARECTLISALAALIVPEDETGPGASDIDIAALEHIVERKKDRQILYRQGLDGFDEAARSEYGQVFDKLTHEQQINLLKLIEGAIVAGKAGDSLFARIRRKAKHIYYKNKLGFEGESIYLFPILVEDVMKVYYSSQVAWDWLGYNGPPMPNGNLGQLSKCEQY